MQALKLWHIHLRRSVARRLGVIPFVWFELTVCDVVILAYPKSQVWTG